jgi:hypothetical protein
VMATPIVSQIREDFNTLTVTTPLVRRYSPVR